VHGAGAVVHAAGAVVAAGGHVAGAALADGHDALVAAGAASAVSRRRDSRCRPRSHAASQCGGHNSATATLTHPRPTAPEARTTASMIVAGLDSSIKNGGPSSALPAHKLGYEAGEVSYFSYAREGGDYTAADTEGSLVTAARRLGAQLRELQRREPEEKSTSSRTRRAGSSSRSSSRTCTTRAIRRIHRSGVRSRWPRRSAGDGRDRLRRTASLERRPLRPEFRACSRAAEPERRFGRRAEQALRIHASTRGTRFRRWSS
jgi:hypothetical protein